MGGEHSVVHTEIKRHLAPCGIFGQTRLTKIQDACWEGRLGKYAHVRSRIGLKAHLRSSAFIR